MSEPRKKGGPAEKRRDTGERPVKAGRSRSTRDLPLLRLAIAYTLMIGIAVLLSNISGTLRDAWLSIGTPVTANSINLAGSGGVPAVPALDITTRTLTTMAVCIGALAVSLPVAWVYLHTHRLRLDLSLVQSIVILPLVVSGIVIVVRDSIALAFSLAGIVAAVRFRNTLKDPKDAVYIFLALGIGLAAGVNALDVALMVSLIFNLVVLVLWRSQIGAISAPAGQTDMLAIGDPSLMIAGTTRARDALKWRLSRETDAGETDGILLIHTEDPEAARQGVELSVSQVASKWRVIENLRRRNGVTTFAVLLALDAKKGDPLALLADLDERFNQQVDAAEYIPFGEVAEQVKKKDKEDKEDKEDKKDKKDKKDGEEKEETQEKEVKQEKQEGKVK